MMFRMNQGHSERIGVTNHNSEWKNCTYIVPSQMVITPEITISKVIGQPTNPFVGIADDFVLFIRRYSDYFTISTKSVAATVEQYLHGLVQSNKRTLFNFLLILTFGELK